MKSVQDLTSADNKSIGFDYQYYYFLYLLLGLKVGQQIGIEVKDDIHLDLPNEEQILLQLKHSVQTQKSGAIINLTELDKDLWHTIDNWVKNINDITQGRKELTKQLEFIKKTKFVLVSNKSVKQIRFLNNVIEFKKRVMSISNIKDYIKDLSKTTTSKNLQDYILNLFSQDDKWLSLFLDNLYFELEEDDLISKIKNSIKEKHVPESKIEDVFSAIDSNIRRHIYFTVKSQKKIIISFEEFYKKYNLLFDRGRNKKLPIRKRELSFSEPLDKQIFIKQLIDIFEVEPNDTDKMIEFTRYMLQINNHLEEWVNEGLLIEEDVEKFEKDAKLKWQNIHREAYRKVLLGMKIEGSNPIEKTIIEQALVCLDQVRKIELVLDETKLDTEMSNGEFYSLSDKPLIGWRLDWEERYNKC
ncbi:hypothetical protein H1S01_15785 [Heliobacterium chlorum]|uniref:Uncharacterized protein n=1 Tax=Heliobacterium chlorum TaxID=2698 RepID=A0ABR7T8J7_HELCL|nr:ABC-three component system protein [Heliobacterium chlorum]MBC9785946.1 hypothetical protein [Heliobacterium chlorum]